MSPYGKLILTTSGDREQEFSLHKSAVEIGRATQNDIVLVDEKISRSHALVECSLQGCTVIDLDSANGTRVNGVRIERVELKPGDVIAVGASSFRYETVSPPAEPL
jgi:pSer/pThr/pTyr-binding forkhead associated (FHA) protein